ncbi:MAG: right-handed parallel beta-helix repeat-containing protein [Clostridia bacterium]|nr:right-handed parallel beta-helix repeat-containing protein [Clostridia bacterium]
MKNKKQIWFFAFLLLIAAAVTAYFYGVYYLDWNVPLYGICMAAIFSEGAAAFALLAKAKEKPKKRALLSALLGGAVAAGGTLFVSLIVNVLIFHQGGARQATAATAVFGFVFALFCVLRLKKLTDAIFLWKPLLAVVLCVCVLCGALLPAAEPLLYETGVLTCAVPTGTGFYTQPEAALVEDADLYVSPDGSDGNDGSFAHPLATIEKARDLVRAMDKTGKNGVTVAVKAGDYRVDTLLFSAEDGGTESCPVVYRAYGDGEVTLNGGVRLPAQAFQAVSDETMLSRLTDDAQKKVVCVPLAEFGITAAQYGAINAFGFCTTAEKYDGGLTGEGNCELFINDRRQTVARYPNGNEYLRTGEVVKEGLGKESADCVVKPEYFETRNPEPDVYRMDSALSKRIAAWKTTKDVWMYGYWRWDWADASTPLGVVDHANRTISPAFVSYYGAIKGAPYYFFNVFEELDAPGEWYLDRDNGVLYLYPPEDFSEDADVELSLSTDNIIRAETDRLTFDGFTVKGTRGDAVCITGSGNTVKNCLIKNVAGNAITMTGNDNLAFGNEITRTGRGGVVLSGGDRETLTPGNNRAENNLVHDWSEIYEAYQPAFTLEGVGNICVHNEMYNSPHEAITYAGNNHVIEYNLIHDVNLKTDDGGAIYANAHWDWCGNLIRYNLIYDLGANGHKPKAIYTDGHLSGETIYGNLIVNVPGVGMHLNGGRWLEVHNNIIINSPDRSIWYDRGGIDDSSEENGRLWTALYASPWQTELWQRTYPYLQRYSDDFSNQDDPDFLPNPSYSSVTGNLIVSAGGKIGEITEPAARFSDISGNAVYRMGAMKRLFVDPANGDYTLRDDAPVYDEIPGFEQLPLQEIGRH